MAQHFIVEIEGFQGEESAIRVLPPNADPYDLDSATEAKLYGVTVADAATGVLKFVDCGYETAEAARAAWPDAVGPTV